MYVPTSHAHMHADSSRDPKTLYARSQRKHIQRATRRESRPFLDVAETTSKFKSKLWLIRV